METTKRLVVVGMACALVVAGLTGCSYFRPDPVPPSTDNVVQTDRSCVVNWEMSQVYDNFGKNAPDFGEQVKFFDPFSAIDLMGAGTGYDMPDSVPGTSSVGVVLLRPTYEAMASDPPYGVVGFDGTTGKGLWAVKVPQTGDNGSFVTVFSNGTDRIGILAGPPGSPSTVMTIDASTGQVVSSQVLPIDSQNGVLGMAGRTIAVREGMTVLGLSADDLSTVVWQRPTQANMGGETLGQCVSTVDGYARIDDGTPVGFGSDQNASALYYRMYSGSVFRWTQCAQANGGCVNLFDPTTNTVVWDSPIPYTVNTSGDIPTASQQAVIVPCDGLCGYRLSDGQQIWHTDTSTGTYPAVVIGEYLVSSDGIIQFDNGQTVMTRNGHGNGVTGQTVFYASDDQTITAYDTSTGWNTLWTVPMPSAGLPLGGLNHTSGWLSSSGGHLFVSGSDGRIWVAQPPPA